MNIYDLISRAQKLRKETQLDSVSPDRVGGLHEDTLKYINEFQLLASSPSLHKAYASVSAMQSDKSPKSDLTGKPLKPGQLVVIVPANQTDTTAGDVYRYDGPSGNTSAWTFVAKIGAVPADAELSATSTNPPQNKVVTEKLTELESKSIYVTNPTNGLGRKLKELYLQGLDNAKEYKVSEFWIHGSDKTYRIFIYQGDSLVAYYNSPIRPIGIIELQSWENSGVTGYAIIDLREGEDNSGISELTEGTIINDVVTNLDNSPSIKSMLIQNDLQQLENVNYTEVAEKEYGWDAQGWITKLGGGWWSHDILFNNNRNFLSATFYCSMTGSVQIGIIDINNTLLEVINKDVVAGYNRITADDFLFDFHTPNCEFGIYFKGEIFDSKRLLYYNTNGVVRYIPEDFSEPVSLANYRLGCVFSFNEIIIPHLVEKINSISYQLNGIRNDVYSSNLQKYINENPVVELLPITYNINEPLHIPNGRRIVGVRGKTIFKLGDNATSIINFDASSSDVMIENVTFEGGKQVMRGLTTLQDLRNRAGEGTRVGIFANGKAKRIHISNCEFQNFDLAGIRLLRTHDYYAWTFKISDCEFISNWYGLLSDIRSEYHTMQGCTFAYNKVGCFIAGGNNFLSCCHFDSNRVGCVISGTKGDNDSHGSITGSSFNHNNDFALCAIDITNGFTFSGCHVFDGKIALLNSIGFSYNAGIIAGAIINEDPNSNAVNMIHNNVFFQSYNGGSISDYTSLDLKLNRFADAEDSTIINN